MNNPTYHNVHNSFKLDGFHLDRDDLCRVAYSYIKEGEDFEKPVGSFLLDWFDDRSYIEMNTSGTTGKPKMIRIDKQAMVNGSCPIIAAQKITSAPTMYFQNLFSGVTPCSINIV
jgi:O-succinylbenzoic acid--CoA ligase